MQGLPILTKEKKKTKSREKYTRIIYWWCTGEATSRLRVFKIYVEQDDSVVTKLFSLGCFFFFLE